MKILIFLLVAFTHLTHALAQDSFESRQRSYEKAEARNSQQKIFDYFQSLNMSAAGQAARKFGFQIVDSSVVCTPDEVGQVCEFSSVKGDKCQASAGLEASGGIGRVVSFSGRASWSVVCYGIQGQRKSLANGLIPPRWVLKYYGQ